MRQSGDEFILHAVRGFRLLSRRVFQPQQLLALALGLFEASDVGHGGDEANGLAGFVLLDVGPVGHCGIGSVRAAELILIGPESAATINYCVEP